MLTLRPPLPAGSIPVLYVNSNFESVNPFIALVFPSPPHSETQSLVLPHDAFLLSFTNTFGSFYHDHYMQPVWK